MTKPLLIADLFCGAGGSSTGAERALKELDLEMILVCVNHWPVAIETHRKNHPSARHYIEDLTVADPERLVPEGYLDLLMASPECRFFSRARGGKPVHDQSRMNPWAVHRWLTSLDVKILLVENVPEFTEWGPVDNQGRPIKEKKGVYFEAWIKALWELGYILEWRFLNAANYGDATTRTRFFLIARKDGQLVHWPEPTHARTGAGEMLGKLPQWKAARDIIDWGNPGRSLLDDPKYKKKPLSINTRRRIARGLQRYGGPFAPLYINLLGLETDGATPAGGPEPFTIQNRNNGRARPMTEPVATVTASNGGGGLTQVRPEVKPFILGQQSCSAPRNSDEPVPTIACAGAISLINPQLVVYHGASNTKQIDDPVPSLPTHAHIGLVNPQLVKYYGTKKDTESVDKPLSTVTTKARFGLCDPLAAPFIVQNRLYGREKTSGEIRAPHSIEAPLPAVTGHGAGALVNPLLVQTDQIGSNGLCSRSLERPLGTIITKKNMAIVKPLIIPYGPRAAARDINQPLHTIMTKDRLSLAEPVMLQVNHGGGDSDNRIKSIDEPTPTITTKRNIGIAEPVLVDANGGEVDPRRLVLVNGKPHILDIRFRMLNNRELARAMGFDEEETEYEFVGNVAEVTKQIGNAVPVNMAAALVKSIFTKEAKDAGETKPRR